MMTIKVRILKRCMISATEVAEPGEVVTLDPSDAAGLLSSGRGVAVDEAQACEAINSHNASAIRSEAQSQPRAPREPLGWLTGGRFH